MPPELFGPLGLTVGALLAVGALGRVIKVLWDKHLEADAEDRRQRDDTFALLKDAVDGTKRLAAALEARNRRDAARQRKTD